MERRKSQRLEAEIHLKFFRVRLPVTFAGTQIEGEGTVYNLSAGGCKVTSETSVPTGTHLALRLYLSPGDPPVAVELAAVRWSMGQDCGVEFLRIPDEAQARLARFLYAQAKDQERRTP